MDAAALGIQAEGWRPDRQLEKAAQVMEASLLPVQRSRVARADAAAAAAVDTASRSSSAR